MINREREKYLPKGASLTSKVQLFNGTGLLLDERLLSVTDLLPGPEELPVCPSGGYHRALWGSLVRPGGVTV